MRDWIILQRRRRKAKKQRIEKEKEAEIEERNKVVSRKKFSEIFKINK